MWPASCSATEMQIPSANRMIPRIHASTSSVLSRPGGAELSRSAQPLPGPSPGPVPPGETLIDAGRFRVPVVRVVQYSVHSVHNVGEGRVSFGEGGDRLLVRRVVDRGQTAACLACLASAPHGRGGGVGARRATPEGGGGAAAAAGRAEPSASTTGGRMSGGLAWASVEPSTNVTIEWIIDCGCT